MENRGLLQPSIIPQFDTIIHISKTKLLPDASLLKGFHHSRVASSPSKRQTELAFPPAFTEAGGSVSGFSGSGSASGQQCSKEKTEAGSSQAPIRTCLGGLATAAEEHIDAQTEGTGHLLHLLHWQADSVPLSHRGSPYSL